MRTSIGDGGGGYVAPTRESRSALALSTKNGGIGVSRGWERVARGMRERERKRERVRGINVARASTTNHSPSDLDTLRALVSSGYFAVPKRTPLLPTARIIPALRSTNRPAIVVTRIELREEEEQKTNPRRQTEPVLPWLHSKRQHSGKFPQQRDDDEVYAANFNYIRRIPLLSVLCLRGKLRARTFSPELPRYTGKKTFDTIAYHARSELRRRRVQVPQGITQDEILDRNP